MFTLLKKLLSTPPAEPTLEATMAESAKRLARWAGGADTATFAKVDDALIRDIARVDPDTFLSDLAAFIGESLRLAWPGTRWVDDPTYGPILVGFEGLPEAKLLPLAVAERRLASKEFSLAEFADSLRARVAAEAALPRDTAPSPAEILATLRDRSGAEAQAAARKQAESFRDYWKFRHRADLPLTLLGVREVERFLRTHQLTNFLGEGRLVQAGLFVGEVGRGLFGGEWAFTALDRVDRAALRYAELDYLPVGRIYRLMVNGEAPQPLDEYLRLIPSARRELAKQQANAGINPTAS